MEFQEYHKLLFDARDGAFSEVTDREHYDSQITLTDLEAQIVTEYFGVNNIHQGNVNSDKLKSKKRFKLYGTQKGIDLNLVFPKPHRSELRLYLAKSRGFKPEGGRIWFIFISNSDELVIGDMGKADWIQLGQFDPEDSEYSVTVSNQILQSRSHKSLPKPKIEEIIIGSRKSFVRNPIFALERFKVTQFSCEIDPVHKTFTSSKTGAPFVEAHHFVPMKFQVFFSEYPLDNINNIISLCPTCHRAFHHAIDTEKRLYVEKVYNERKEIRELFSLEKVFSFYNIIDL